MTNIFAGNGRRIFFSIVLQESQDGGLTFSDTSITTTQTTFDEDNLNSQFDTEANAILRTVTGASGVITPETDYMYRLVLRAARSNADGDAEDTDSTQPTRLRLGVNPSLHLTLSLIHISEPTRPY